MASEASSSKTQTNCSRNLNFNKEADRLLSFEDWPISYIDINMMARVGFFYQKCMYSADKVRCFFCKKYFESWLHGTCPLAKHVEISPTCPLFSRKTFNVPLNKSEMDSLMCTARAIKNQRAYTKVARFPCKALVKDRYNSLLTLRSVDRKLSELLCENGFYYEWTIKKYLCFCCGLEYKHVPNMTVEEYHALNSCACEFVNTEYGHNRVYGATRNKLLSNIKISKSTNLKRQDMARSVCVICYDACSEYIATPCRHLLYCENCVTNTLTRCPICKKETHGDVLKIFFP